MTKTHILALVAVAAVAYAIGYRRAAARASASNSGPVIGGGTDWLNWQAV